MASRLTKAIALSLAVAIAPLAVGSAQAGGALLVLAEPTPTEALTASIVAAVGTAQSAPSYATASPTGKIALIQAAVAGVLATADPAIAVAALNAAVAGGTISAAVAVQVAAAVSPALAAQVAAANGLTVTASTGGSGGTSVLVSLASVATGGAPPAAGAPTAAFDPCAGVVATYCGS